VHKHTCKETIILEPKNDRKEPFDPSHATGLMSRESDQKDSERPDYKNIKVHGEEHRANSYPVTYLDSQASPEDRKLTNYPFRMEEDENGNIKAVYAQNDPTVELTKEKDKQIYEMYYPGKYSGDTMIARRMGHMATMPKRAIEARSKLDKYVFVPFLEEELEQHANSIWWERDELEHEF